MKNVILTAALWAIAIFIPVTMLIVARLLYTPGG